MIFWQCCCCADDIRQPDDTFLVEDIWSVTERGPSAVMPLGKEDQEKAPNEATVNGDPGPRRFHVNVERTDKSVLGMDLSSAGPVLMVNSIAHGATLISVWNKICEKSQRVERFDRLVSVNGFSGARGKDTLDKLKVCTGQLVLVFERPSWFEAEFEVLDGEELGLAMSPGPDFILIHRVQEGPVEEHNANIKKSSGAPGCWRQMKFGTRVVEVNGQTGTGSELTRLARAAAGKTSIKFINWS